MPDALPEPQAGAPPERPADRRAVRRSRSRWAVHLGLLCSAAAALGTLDLLHVRIAIHTDVGLVFVGLVVVHLAQRRRTLARMATRARTLAGRGDPPRRFGPPAPVHHRERARLGPPGLEPRRADTAAASRAVRQVARHLRGRARGLPGGARLAPEEAPPAVDDPLMVRSVGPGVTTAHCA